MHATEEKAADKPDAKVSPTSPTTRSLLGDLPVLGRKGQNVGPSPLQDCTNIIRGTGVIKASVVKGISTNNANHPLHGVQAVDQSGVPKHFLCAINGHRKHHG